MLRSAVKRSAICLGMIACFLSGCGDDTGGLFGDTPDHVFEKLVVTSHGWDFTPAPVTWGDIDADGDLDFATGFRGDLRLYINSGDAFQRHELLDSLQNAALAWGDYDRDGDLDLALGGGHVSLGRLSRILRNALPVLPDSK